MKELSIEQKARAYDEALEKSKRFYEQGTITESLAYIFPELKESEDERIRKEIIVFLEELSKLGKNTNFDKWKTSDCANWIAWLEKQGDKSVHIDIESMVSSYEQRLKSQGGIENSPLVNMCLTAFRRGVENTLEELNLKNLEKQGEQKPTDKAEPKFHEGDWVVNNISGGVCQVTEIRDDEYCFWPLDAEIKGYLRIIDVDNDYHLWTIQDAKPGDVIYLPNGNNEYFIFIFKGIENAAVMSFAHFYQYNDGTSVVEETIDRLYSVNDIFQPSTTEQRDLLFQKMKEAGYEWDADNKELKKIHVIDEGKAEMDYCFTKMMNGEKVSSAWSEEDENISVAIENHLIEYYVEKRGYPYVANKTSQEMKEFRWLKSLKQRIGG